MTDALTGSSVVTIGASSNPYFLCSIQNVIDHVNPTDNSISLTSSVTSRFVNYVSMFSIAAENHCQRPLKEQNYYGIYTPNEYGFIVLREVPIVRVNSVYTRTDNFSAWTLVASGSDNRINVGDYDEISLAATGNLNSICGYGNNYGGFNYIKNGYMVNYVAGSPDSKLEGLKQVVIEDCALFYLDSKLGDGRLGLNSEALPSGVGAVQRQFTRLTKEHEAILEGFKKTT